MSNEAYLHCMRSVSPDLKLGLGVLDVGAGTGCVTLMSLAASGAPVHAVEPARAMRSSLMTRLAALPGDRAALHGVSDVAVCHNAVACMTPAARRALWPALAEALVPGGVLLVQLPPAVVPPRRIKRVLPTRRVGQHAGIGIRRAVGAN